MINKHTFHIPVMGVGYTIDTPLKVAHYGIDSVVSIGDDLLMEKMRKKFCTVFGLEYKEITKHTFDYRALRTTSYLNLLNDLVKKKFDELKNSANDKKDEIKKYLSMLPNNPAQRVNGNNNPLNGNGNHKDFNHNDLIPGKINVNIMTKIDKENYWKNEKLPSKYNDAHAALRGYALSDLNSSIVFSAGLNPRLFSYLAEFDDFYPDNNGKIKKKIILKVSDFRSALIQGKYLAKKGLWVSEYRIESGLNCGGHAFATDGHLMGPILAEFRDKRQELIDTIHELLIKALEEKNKFIPEKPLSLKISAQGGVGTAAEHNFLLEHYKIDSVGWGSPFLLVPEATNVDYPTMVKLIEAKEDDLYLSNVSPLGVPFNNLRNNSKDNEKEDLIKKGKPGSPCPKKHLSTNTEFTEKVICTASRQYQNLKIQQLDNEETTEDEYKTRFNKIVDKACLCLGLGTSALLVNNIDNKIEGEGVSICPGPNIAYFSRIMTLKDMTDHIYGRTNVIDRQDRPNMFIKELMLYIDYLKNKIEESKEEDNTVQEKYFKTFIQNLNDGINYYNNLFQKLNMNLTDVNLSSLKAVFE